MRVVPSGGIIASQFTNREEPLRRRSFLASRRHAGSGDRDGTGSGAGDQHPRRGSRVSRYGSEKEGNFLP